MSQPSTAELLQHHFKYEFDMLQDTYSLIGKHPYPINNALIESFCVHARALIEFFEKERGARKYTGGGYSPFSGWDKTRKADLVRKLNNQVAHLLDGRTANPADQINGADQAELKAVLGDERARFEAHLLPIYASAADPLTIRTHASAPSSTNAIDSTDVRTIPPRGNNVWGES